MNEKQQKILEFLRQQLLCVVSTVNEAGHPESALVAFSETSDLKLIFTTDDTSRKYHNLVQNPNLSVVVGWSEDARITVQYEGVARVVEGAERQEYEAIHFTKQPGSMRRKTIRTEQMIVITPVWARYTDYGHDPAEIYEEDLGAD